MTGWSIGTAERDITPRYPSWLHGYANRNRPSEGVADRIALQCLAISNGEGTLLIYAMDMIGIHDHVCEGLYALLEREVGIGYPDVMLSCSHTHFAPGLHDMSYNAPEVGILGPDPRFVSDFETKLVEAAEEALRSIRPARMERVSIETPQVLFNRRTALPSNQVEMNLLYPEDPSRYLFGEVDPELAVLRFVDDTGVRALLCNLGCHPVASAAPAQQAPHYLISADYPGYLRRVVEADYGCPVMFTLGAAGDAVPTNRYGDSRPQMGAILGNSILLAERRYQQDQDATLDSAYAEMEAETIIAPDHHSVRAVYDEARAQAIALSTQRRGPVSEATYAEAEERFVTAMRALFRSHLYPGDRHTIRAQFVRIGSTTLVGLPFEVLSEFSLRMREIYPRSILCSCTGGYQGYLPFAYEYERGGYEASERSTHFVPGTTDRLYDLVVEQLGMMGAQ